MDSQLRITRNKQVQVVRLYFKSQYLHLLLFCHLLNNGLQSILNAIDQYLASSLGTPYEVVVYKINLIPGMLVFPVDNLAQNNTTVNYFRREIKAHSSPAST
jgi:hypothetical protein